MHSLIIIFFNVHGISSIVLELTMFTLQLRVLSLVVQVFNSVISSLIVCEDSVLSSKQSNARIGLYKHPLHRYTSQPTICHAVFLKIV